MPKSFTFKYLNSKLVWHWQAEFADSHFLHSPGTMEGMDVDCTVDVYCDWHRHFMQVLLSRPVLAPDEVTKVVMKICGEDAIRGDNAQRQLKTFLKTVQEKIQLLGLDLRKGNSEITGKPVYALINTSASDEVAVKKETCKTFFFQILPFTSMKLPCLTFPTISLKIELLLFCMPA